MTLLSICEDAADEIGIQRPASVIGSSDPAAQKLLRYAKKVGNNVMKKTAWQDLREEQTFTAIAGETQTGILPDDFDRFVPETFWDRGNTRFYSGPVSAVEWQSRKAHSYDGTIRKFAYRGGSVLISPGAGGGETFVFEYVSKNWCQSSDGTAQATWEADTDTAIVDEELITLGIVFEYLDGDGQPSARAFNQCMDYWNQLLENDQPDAQVLSAGDIFGPGRHFGGAPAADG